MVKKTLILAIDLSGGADWQVSAMQRQMADWIEANKAVLPFEKLIVFPTLGETRLYWLEGEHNKIDTAYLQEVKDRLKPVLEIALDIKIDKTGLYKRPDKIKELIKKDGKSTR